MQTKGPSSTALCPAQTHSSCLSMSRNKAAHTKLPLWILPLSDWYLLSCFLSSAWFVQLALCGGSHALQVLTQPPLEPTSAFATLSIHAWRSYPLHKAQAPCACSELWALWLTVFESCEILCFPNVSMMLMISICVMKRDHVIPWQGGWN